ncbi:collagen-like protein [Candidatus Kaiserbacteria bacterium]|nr:collagen-like protein [Candidatus Kaiserbacteria bacterium]MCB9812105.1 collagen-like protein [Candidatus Nomurabacteria bacterium]
MSNDQFKIPLLVAIMLFWSTVAPVIVSAEDSAVITNSVSASTETGGISQSGTAGKNGQDGSDGRNGADGTDGASGQSGASSAAVLITNHIHGSESHTVIVTATSGVAAVQSANTVSATTSHYEVAQKPTSNASSGSQALQLLSLLHLLQETLTAYVQKLF